MTRPCPWNHHTYPQSVDTMMCSKKTNDHGFGNELEAKYWLRLKFSFPPEASRPVHALSILNGRVPGSAIPLLYNMLCSANANIKAPLCSACRVEVRLWPQPSPRGELQLVTTMGLMGTVGKSCSFHCPSLGFNLLNRLIRIERAWPMPHEKLP